MTKKNIYGKIMEARLMFLQSNPKKSGRNDFQKFNYYELDDIVPTATRICNELGIYTEVDMGSHHYGFATMTAINVERESLFQTENAGDKQCKHQQCIARHWQT